MNLRELHIRMAAAAQSTVTIPRLGGKPERFALPRVAEDVEAMVQAFNAALATGLSGTESSVLQVDLYSTSKDQAANPTQYGLTNVTTPACDLAGVLAELPTSLVCTTDTLVAGVTETWAFADTVHPTPYGYKLIAQLVNIEMAKKGWL